MSLPLPDLLKNKEPQSKLRLLKERDEIIKNFHSKYIFQSDGSLRPNCLNKIYLDKSLYQGEYLDELRSGKGLYIYSNGDLYCGDWEADKFHGMGIYIFSNGERYEGHLEHGLKCGYGVYYYENGNQYEGFWQNNLKNGQGKYINVIKKEIYHGSWQNGEKHGKGIFYFENSIQLEANLHDGFKHGKCEFKLSDYTSIKGNFDSDVFSENQCLVLFSNKDYYEGDLLDGEISGLGTFYADNKREIYEGEWRINMKNGRGLYTYANGDKYDGEWKDDLKSGMGVYYYANGQIYEGEWKEDFKDGYG